MEERDERGGGHSGAPTIFDPRSSEQRNPRAQQQPQEKWRRERGVKQEGEETRIDCLAMAAQCIRTLQSTKKGQEGEREKKTASVCERKHERRSRRDEKSER